MKKSRILGYALTLAATLFVGSAMGQLTPNDQYGNFVEVKSATTTDENYVSYQTVGAELGFYVAPDVAYHPGWATGAVAPLKYTLTPGFTWVWTIPAGVDANGATGNQSIADNNYIKLKAAAAGVYPISVKVTGTATGPFKNICAGEVQNFSLVVVPKPSIGTTAGGVDATNGCTAIVGHDLTAAIKANGNITFQFEVNCYNAVPNAGTGVLEKGTKIVANSKTYSIAKSDFPIAWQTYNVPAATSYDNKTYTAGTSEGINFKVTTAANPAAIATAQSVITFTYKNDFPVPTGKSAVIYSLEFKKLTDLVSRKSGYNAVDGTTGTAIETDLTSVTPIDVVAMTAPKTGPVYHIGNNVAK